MRLKAGNYQNLDSFEAVDRLITTSLRALNEENRNNSDIQTQLNKIYANAVNNLLLQSQYTSAVILKTLYSGREEATYLVTLNSSLSFAGTIILTLFTTVFIIKLYFEEKNNISAVVRLNSKKVEELTTKLSAFKRALEAERGFDERYLNRTRNLSEGNKNPASQKKPAKKDHLRVPNSTGLKRKYFMYMLRCFMFLSSAVGLITYFLIAPINWISSLEVQERQLYFSNWMRLRISIAAFESSQLLWLNGTAIVEGKSASEQYTQTLSDFDAMKEGVFGLLLEDRKDYNSDLSDILFTNGCDILSSKYIGLCSQIQASMTNPSFSQFIYKFEETVRYRYETYMASDRSPGSIYSLFTNTSSALFTLRGIMSQQNQIISNIINQRLENSLSQTKINTDVNLGTFSLLLIVIALIGWFYLYGRLTETSNEFKKILQAFPASVILSSFTLKLFLLKTSKGVLNSIKHQI